MEKNERRTMFLNRMVSFLVGGLLVFAVMSFTVVSSANAENEELAAALDTSRFEAERLLEDAKAQLSNRDYAEAEASLTALFANQPGSDEATEGRALLSASGGATGHSRQPLGSGSACNKRAVDRDDGRGNTSRS